MKQTNTSSPKRVPKLRFPEFQDAPEWEEEKFSNLYSLKATNTLSRDKLNYESGTVKNIHYGDIHTKFSTIFRIEQEDVPFINPSEPTQSIKQDSYCKIGDMVFADASEDLDDVGKSIEITSLNGERVVSGLHTILARQKGKKLIVGFGGHLFKSELLRKQIQREAQGAKVLGISGGRLSNIDVCFPNNTAEQQRIADCLSSLDEWIAAEAQWLDALKDHKKGLMQQLFPCEGETTPKLRFPEFRGAPEWEEKRLGDICDMQAGLFVRASEISEKRENNSYPCYGGNGLRGFTKSYTHEGKYSLIGRQGALCGNVKLVSGRFHATEHAVVTTAKSNIDVDWLYYQLYLLKLNRFATGQAQPGLSVDVIKNVPTLLTSENNEQLRIASCLSSIDDLITAQSNKLDALKEHKKGFMQQLFPSGERGDS